MYSLRCIDSWNKYSCEINKINKAKFVNKLTCPDIDLTKYSRTNLKNTINKHTLLHKINMGSI